MTLFSKDDPSQVEAASEKGFQKAILLITGNGEARAIWIVEEDPFGTGTPTRVLSCPAPLLSLFLSLSLSLSLGVADRGFSFRWPTAGIPGLVDPKGRKRKLGLEGRTPVWPLGRGRILACG